jgi:tetratricopeptide (TPR) repeat protein
MKLFFVFIAIVFSYIVFSQDLTLLEEAKSLERQFKTEEAIKKYQEILKANPNDQKSLLRVSELYCMMGNETENEERRKQLYQLAISYADRIWLSDSTTADAHYAKALVYGRQITYSSVKEKALLTKKIKEEADKALVIDPNHFKSLYTLAKWNDEVSSLNPAAKAALKVFFGGLPSASIEEAIRLYQEVRKLSPTFILNNYDLALALKKSGKPDQAITIMNAQMKYPIKTTEDQLYKNLSKQLLISLQ